MALPTMDSVQQRVHRLHRIANDHDRATMPPFQSIHSQVSLIPDLLSAEGNSTTHRVVETDKWRDNLHATRLPSHDAPGRHATLE
jgi:hypothetical protein